MDEARVLKDGSNLLVQLAPAPVILRIATFTAAVRASAAETELVPDRPTMRTRGSTASMRTRTPSRRNRIIVGSLPFIDSM